MTQTSLIDTLDDAEMADRRGGLCPWQKIAIRHPLPLSTPPQRLYGRQDPALLHHRLLALLHLSLVLQAQ